MNVTLRAPVSLHHVMSLSALAIIASARLASVCAQAPELEVERGALINGTRLPALEVTRGELNAFAWLHPADSPQEVTCSGVLITPIHLLTAAHCFEPYSFRGFGVGFGLSPLEEAGRAYAQVRQARAHPSLDLAVVTLVRPPVLRVAPISVPVRALDEIALDRVEVMGYGERRDRDRPSGRYFLTLEVVEIEPDSIRAAPLDPESGVCFGDSGGPGLVHLPASGVTRLSREFESGGEGGLEGGEMSGVEGGLEVESESVLSIVGVESAGSASCRGVERLARVDAGLDWIRAALHGEPEAACPVGKRFCDGLTLYACPYGRVVRSDCPNVELCEPARDALERGEDLELLRDALRDEAPECALELPEGWGESAVMGPPQATEGGCEASRGKLLDKVGVWLLVLLGVIGQVGTSRRTGSFGGK